MHISQNFRILTVILSEICSRSASRGAWIEISPTTNLLYEQIMQGKPVKNGFPLQFFQQLLLKQQMLICVACGNGDFLIKYSQKGGERMLNENIKTIRKSKGLSQEELAEKLHVVRQTISKWEQGLSVPDSDMLIAISEVLETSVSTLLGENVAEKETDELKEIAERLEIINSEFAKRKELRRKTLHIMFITLCALTVIITAVLIFLNSPYKSWDYSNIETAVLATAFHSFEWLFARISPVILIGSAIGIALTRSKYTVVALSSFVGKRCGK